MAQDNRKITIEILSKETSNNETSSGSINTPNKIKTLKKKEKNISGKGILINQLYAQAKSNLGASISNSMNRYFNLSEDYIAEREINNFKISVNKITNTISSVAGASIVGGPLGGTIALIGVGVSEYLNNQQTLSNYYSSINASNYNTQFSRIRAGLVDNGRGTEN